MQSTYRQIAFLILLQNLLLKVHYSFSKLNKLSVTISNCFFFLFRRHTHNSKNIWYTWVFHITNNCSTIEDMPFVSKLNARYKFMSYSSKHPLQSHFHTPFWRLFQVQSEIFSTKSMHIGITWKKTTLSWKDGEKNDSRLHKNIRKGDRKTTYICSPYTPLYWWR